MNETNESILENDVLDYTAYAPSTGGFYVYSIHGDTIPADAITITQELYEQLLEGQSEGLVITAPDSTHSMPWLATPPPPTADELQALFDSMVTARLDAFARTPYSPTEQPFSSMEKARLASLTTEYKQWGDRANQMYNITWQAAEPLIPHIRAGALTVEMAMTQLPTLSWTD